MPELTKETKELLRDPELAESYITDLYAKISDLQSQVVERDATLDLIRNADMRGIKMWQEATGQDMVWPDRGKMIFWLLEQLAHGKDPVNE